MGISVKSKEATWLIESIIWGSKNLPQRNHLTKRQAILMVAATMGDNRSAAPSLARQAELTEPSAAALLKRAGEAARSLAASYREDTLQRVLNNDQISN